MLARYVARASSIARCLLRRSRSVKRRTQKPPLPSPSHARPLLTRRAERRARTTADVRVPRMKHALRASRCTVQYCSHLCYVTPLLMIPLALKISSCHGLVASPSRRRSPTLHVSHRPRSSTRPLLSSSRTCRRCVVCRPVSIFPAADIQFLPDTTARPLSRRYRRHTNSKRGIPTRIPAPRRVDAALLARPVRSIHTVKVCVRNLLDPRARNSHVHSKRCRASQRPSAIPS